MTCIILVGIKPTLLIQNVSEMSNFDSHICKYCIYSNFSIPGKFCIRAMDNRCGSAQILARYLPNVFSDIQLRCSIIQPRTCTAKAADQ